MLVTIVIQMVRMKRVTGQTVLSFFSSWFRNKCKNLSGGEVINVVLNVMKEKLTNQLCQSNVKKKIINIYAVVQEHN